MYKAVCADCGKECEVPFKPHQDRPVYCAGCWAKRGRKRGPSRKAEREEKETIEREGKNEAIAHEDCGIKGRGSFIMPVCEICGEIVDTVYRCAHCGAGFCRDCSDPDPEKGICALC